MAPHRVSIGRRGAPSLLLVLMLLLCIPGGSGAAQEAGHGAPGNPPVEGPAPSDPPVVALVLAGGGALGFAHVGVLEVLEEVGMPIDMVVGTSMGAIAGGLYAIGYRAEDLREIVLGTDWLHLLVEPPLRARSPYREHRDPTAWLVQGEYVPGGSLRTPGFISGSRITSFLHMLVGDARERRSFDDLPLVYRAVAVDITDASPVILSEGSLVQAMRASMAVPGIFDPVLLDGRLLVDGGLARNLPVDVARDLGADVVIAVNLTGRILDDIREFRGITDVLTQTINLAILQTTAGQRELADVVIEPVVDSFSAASFGSAEELMEAGHHAAVQQRDTLALMAQDLRERRAPGPPLPEPVVSREVEIHNVQIVGAHRRDERRIRRHLARGTPPTIEALHQQLVELTAAAPYRSVSFMRSPDSPEGEGEDAPPGATGLVITFEERDDPFLFLRFGLAYESHFGPLEEQEFSGALHAVAMNVTTGGSELEVLQSFGRNFRTAVTYRYPLGGAGSSVSAAVALHYDELLFTLHDTGDPREQYRLRHPRGEGFLELQLTGFAVVRAGYQLGGVDLAMRYSHQEIPSVRPFNGVVSGGEVVLEWDSLNQVPFPYRGGHGTVGYRRMDARLAGDVTYHRVDVQYRRYGRIARRHAVGVHLRGATSLDSTLPLWDTVWVGGIEDMPGRYLREERGAHLALLTGEYRWTIPGLPPLLRDRTYLVVRGGVASLGNGSLDTFLEGDGRTIWGVDIGPGISTPVGSFNGRISLSDGGTVRAIVALGLHF